MVCHRYNAAMPDLTAFVLAGGKSSRMGSDKAFLELEGKSLLVRALELAHTVTDEVRIVGQRDKFEPFGPVIEDIYTGRGGLGGIHASLTATSTDLNLILAVDTPFLRPEFLRYLVSEARRCPATITVPRLGSGFQPLCAVYRRSFLARAEQALQAGKNKIDPLYTPADTHILSEPELIRLGFFAEMFDNLNTREEWERAQRSRLSH